MKVILLKDVAKIGRRFDITNVPDGYALNKLIPQKLAQPATPENVSRVKAQASQIEAQREQAQAQFTSALEKLDGATITITADGSEEGRLFQAVKAEEILAVLAQEYDVTLSPDQVLIKTPIKQTGEHAIELVSGEQNASLALQVVTK